MLLFGLCSGQNKFHSGIEFIWKRIYSKKTLYIQILCTNYKINLIFDCMSKDVVTGKSSVGNENRMSSIGIPIHEIANGMKFIFSTSGLNFQIKITFRAYLIQGDGMNHVKTRCRFTIRLMVSIWIVRIPGNIKLRAITSDEIVFIAKFF